MVDHVPWICPSCSNAITTPYCPTCGERPLRERDLTLCGLVGQFVHAVSAVDSRLLRTIRCLVNQPGRLTRAYVQGHRVAYIGPFQLFVIANVLLVAVQSLTGANVFSSPLDSHLQQQDWRNIAQTLVTSRIDTLQTSIEQYAPVFNRSVALYAKWLVILMVLPFALFLPLVFYREPRPFVTHAVFALHLYTILLLLFSTSLLVAVVDVLLGGDGLRSAYMDNVLSVFNLCGCAAYLYFATGTVYGTSGILRILSVLLLTAGVGVIVLGYRFALFLITLYAT